MSNREGPRPGSGTRVAVGRVLVVEDHDAMVEAYRDLLEDEGYSVRVARDGVEALAMLRSEPIGVVVLDLSLPVMGGREMRRRQLEDAAIAHVPVLVVTADPRATIEGLPLLRKPFEADAFLSEIRRLQSVGEETARAGKR